MRVTILDPFGVVRFAGRTARSSAVRAEDAAISALDAALRSELASRAVCSLVEGPLGDVGVQAAVRCGLVDRVAGQMLEAGLVERVAGVMLEAGVAENVADRVLAGQELDRLVTRVLEDPATSRLVAQVLDSRLLDESVARVLQSEELWLVVEEVARSPAVMSAISRGGAGFADQVVGEVGERSRRADAWLERAAQRMLHRRPSPTTPAGGP